MVQKGEYGYNPHYQTAAPFGHDKESAAAIEAKWPNTNDLRNPRYERLIKDYYKCVFQFLDQTMIPQKMEQQLNRHDLDTVCAYELFMMKKYFVNDDVLDMDSFVGHQL